MVQNSRVVGGVVKELEFGPEWFVTWVDEEAEDVRFLSFLRRVNSSKLKDGRASILASRLKSLLKENL